MAMAISDTTGQTVTPTEMARLAQITGDRDETGVNWNFINNAANYYGVHTLQSTNPTREFIESSLNTGSPVVLSGQSDGDVNSPYTSSGHYVVAVGKDSNGNAIINDPRGRNYSKSISIDNLVGHTGSAWLVGNKNTSTLPVSIRYEKRGGRGDDYLTWLQSDPRWADKKLGSSGETMKTAGCAVTTVAKLTVYSQSITDSSYNPGYLCDYLNSNGGLDGNGCINWGAAPGLKHEGRGDFNNPSKEEVIKRIGELMSSGYYVALCVDNGGHYVAVIKVTNDGIVMSDPAQNSTTNLFDKYSAQSCDSYHYFSGAKSPQDIGNGTGAKSSTDTMSRIASIFGKYGSAIFKSAYTGDWNINWDEVFAEDASTDASVATGVPGDDVTLSGSDNAEKIRNYLRGNLGFTEAGAAGVMGNWMVESGLEPGNLENTFEPGGSNAISPGYTDESYVAAIDSKKYTKTQFMSDANHTAE